MEEERQPKSAGLERWHFGQLRHGLTWSRGLGYRAIERLPDGLWTDCALLESVWHRRADAPVGLGRASGSVPWGRGSRRREREPVFPDHSSGVILQPDRLLQACLHPSLSISLSLLLASSPSLFSCYYHRFLPSSFPDDPVVSQAPFTSSIQYYRHPSVLPSPSLHLSHFNHLNFLLLFVKRLSSRHHFVAHISLTVPLISSIGSVPFRRSLVPSPSLFPSIFLLLAPIHLCPAVTLHLGQPAQQMG